MTSTDELERLLADATPGPWRQGQPDSRKVHPHWRDKDGNDRDDCLHKNGWAKTIATVGKEEGDWRDGLQQRADAALIVAAVNALPELVEKVKRLEEALKPFAAVAGRLSPDISDDRYAWPVGGVSAGDLRRARAALNQEPGQ